MTRVAMIIPASEPAGGIVARNVDALVGALEDRSVGVEVLTHEADLTNRNVFYLRRPEEAFDVAHVHGRVAPTVLRAAQRTSPRVIFTPHFYAREPQKLRQLAQGRMSRADRQLLAAAADIVCVSRSEALQVRRHAHGAKLHVIPSGIDAASIAGAAPLPVDGRVIVSADSLTRWTGVHRLISALPALSPSYKLAVIGSGRGSGALEAHADYLGVGDRVWFLGELGEPELYPWLRTASVVAMLQEESLWGGTLLEAGAAGAPVVASDIPAYREAAAFNGRDGVTFVSRRASPFAIADAIRDQAMAEGRPDLHLLPSWDDIAEQTLSIYREAALPRVAA